MQHAGPPRSVPQVYCSYAKHYAGKQAGYSELGSQAVWQLCSQQRGLHQGGASRRRPGSASAKRGGRQASAPAQRAASKAAAAHARAAFGILGVNAPEGCAQAASGQ